MPDTETILSSALTPDADGEAVGIVSGNCLATAKKMLAVIGKRLVANNGASIFDNITPSSAEENVITEFIDQALLDVCSRLRQVITQPDPDGSSRYMLTVLNTRHGTAEAGSSSSSSYYHKMMKKYIENYCAMFAVASFIQLVQPDLAPPYFTIAEQSFNRLRIYALHKDMLAYTDNSATPTVSTSVSTNT